MKDGYYWAQHKEFQAVTPFDPLNTYIRWEVVRCYDYSIGDTEYKGVERFDGKTYSFDDFIFGDRIEIPEKYMNK